MNYGNREYRFEVARKVDVALKEYYEGRNCRLQVEICGTRNPRTAMIMDLGDLDDGIEKILTKYDHKTILYPFERLADSLWYNIREFCNLTSRIRLYERDHVWYDKGDNDFMDVTRRYVFSAAHKTENKSLSHEENVAIYGKCNTLHGHEYALEVTVRGPLNRDGNIIGPNYMDEQVTEVLGEYDRQIINKNEKIPGGNATTENFIKVLWTDIKDALEIGGSDFKLQKLRLRETARNYFDYYGE